MYLEHLLLLVFDCFMLLILIRLGRYAVESYLEQILSHGFFHADPVSTPLLVVMELFDL